MEMIVLIVHVLVAASIIGLVLIQHGKGADVGASFGTGSAGSVFGSAGSANFMSRLTAALALVFFLTSMGLTWLSTKRGVNQGVMAAPAAAQKAPSTSDIPAAPVVPAAPAAKSAADDKSAKPAAGDGSKAAEAQKEVGKQ